MSVSKRKKKTAPKASPPFYIVVVDNHGDKFTGSYAFKRFDSKSDACDAAKIMASKYGRRFDVMCSCGGFQPAVEPV